MKNRSIVARVVVVLALVAALAPQSSAICGNCRVSGGDFVFCGASPYDAEHCVTRRCINEGPFGLEFSVCCFSLGPCTY